MQALIKDPVDLHLGKRLETLRLAQGKTLQAIANELNITYQQIRKYENGENRISASTLYRLARALDVQPSFFFEGMDAVREPDVAVNSQPPLEPAYEELLDRVRDGEVREALRHLFVRMAKLGSP